MLSSSFRCTQAICSFWHDDFEAMVGSYIPLLRITNTELQGHLYVGMQPCHHLWILRNLGLMGAPLAAGSLSIIGLSGLRYTTGIAAPRQQQICPSGRNHGKSSTIVWIGFPLQRKTVGTMKPVDHQHNNYHGYATIGMRPRHTETNINGWAIDTVKELRFARSFCFTGVYSRHG